METMPSREAGNAPLDGSDRNLEALMQLVLRESYLQSLEDLRDYAEKVKYYNNARKAGRLYLRALVKLKADVRSTARERGVNLCCSNVGAAAVFEAIFAELTHSYESGPVESDLCIPDRIPAAGLNSLTQLEAEIARWEERLKGLGDDAQLVNTDIQVVLQKQQQLLQMLSNLSKSIHDNIMAVIRKLSG